jgi:hypothetical protein
MARDRLAIDAALRREPKLGRDHGLYSRRPLPLPLFQSSRFARYHSSQSSGGIHDAT